MQARATGQGCDVDTCLFDAALHQLGYAAIWYLNEGYVPERQTRSAHFSRGAGADLPDRRRLDLRDVPHRQVLERAARRARHARTRRRPALRRRRPRARRTASALTETLDAEFRKHPTAHWIEGAGAACCRSRRSTSSSEALESPFLRTNEHDQQRAAPRRAPTCACSPTRSRSTASACRSTCARRSGADNDAVLGRLAATAK